MRKQPSLWNKIDTFLGFRRKRRKKSRRPDFMNRRSLFEQLEVRAMLSATTGTEQDPTEETVVAGSLNPSAATSAQFAIVDGDSKDLFSVSTTYEELGKPTAHISLKSGADIAVREWHEIELELQVNLLSVSRHLVRVMLAGDEIV